MRRSATILVAVTTTVHLASSRRVDVHPGQHLLNGTSQDAEGVQRLDKALEEQRKEDNFVNVAGLDFHTDVTVITEALYSFGQHQFQTGLGLYFRKGQWSMAFGGWVTECRKEGENGLIRHEQIGISALERLDNKSMQMVPYHWFVMHREDDRDQKEVRAVRRSTTRSGYLCLWTAHEDQNKQDVVVLKDASGHCGVTVSGETGSWSEATGRISDLCQ